MNSENKDPKAENLSFPLRPGEKRFHQIKAEGSFSPREDSMKDKIKEVKEYDGVFINDRYDYWATSPVNNGPTLYDKKLDIFFPATYHSPGYVIEFNDFIYGRKLRMKYKNDKLGMLDLTKVYTAVMRWVEIDD
ncbi:MAG: hypothetical protein ACTSPV_00395 [Candidatus Hodarchaeales archaeon]